MELGVFVATKIDDWELIREAEALGYDRAWVPDSQMIWSDCYATLALAAANTTRIKLGTGVAIPGTRLAPVTAHSIASINRLAPGRVFLGIGTGHTAMRVMGMPPMPVGAFCDYLRVVRALLRGDEVDYTHDGVTRAIRFLHLEVHGGPCTYLVPAERRFVTPETIRASALVGEPDEVIAQIRAAEAAGLREIALLPSMATARTVLREFGERVIARY